MYSYTIYSYIHICMHTISYTVSYIGPCSDIRFTICVNRNMYYIVCVLMLRYTMYDMCAVYDMYAQGAVYT
jgi:hypothetical protein